jgi:XTP/dITP diphosphohydrolase
MQLLIATTNQGKIIELQKLLAGSGYEIVSPSDIDLVDFDVDETGTTFEENALLKAKAFAIKTGLPTLADDSGLAVDALDGRPGVYSKRYGEDDLSRNQKLLDELKNTPEDNRSAHFVCVIAFYNPETKQTLTAEGRVDGFITKAITGTEGFGYDPVFFSRELGKTFAESSRDEKNTVSHRARALEKMKKLLK